jgi:hypothetical protein
VLGRGEFAQLVIVDNASTDGSRELLNALSRAGLIHLIRNRTQRYHGPALTQGISWLARRQGKVAARDRLQYVWILDSDVIVFRSDVVRDALEIFERTDAAAVGQKADSPSANRRLRHNPEFLLPCSLMFDPRQIWRAPLPPFLETGSPPWALQLAADENRVRLVAFPFVEDEYLIHLGRGTLHEVAESGDTTNAYYDWALEHHDPYFAGEQTIRLVRRFSDLFDEEVGDLSPERLAAACLRPRLLTVV